MPNNRVLYAIEDVKIAGLAAFTGFNSSSFVHGAQSAGVKTDFRLEQVFELGQLAIYENIENIPNVEVTVEKVLDGYPLMWHMATADASARTLIGRSTAKANLSFGIWPDTYDATSGTSLTAMVLSGIYTSSLSYAFPVNGNFTESVTLVCNNKRWYSDSGTAPSGAMTGYATSFATTPDRPRGSGGVNRREDMLFDYTAGVTATDNNGLPVYTSGCILPRQIPGVDSSGRNYAASTTGTLPVVLQNIRVNSNFGREELFELGRKLPYCRYVKFPTEVTCEFEIISISGDWIEATEEGIHADGTNLQVESIRLVTREGTRITLGTQNKLQSVNVGGGDTGGANQTITYTYSTFNDFTVMHTGDPNGALAASTFALYN